MLSFISSNISNLLNNFHNCALRYGADKITSRGQCEDAVSCEIQHWGADGKKFGIPIQSSYL